MPLLENALFTLGGFALALVWDLAKDQYRFRRELKENDNIRLSGDWVAAWQTSVDGKEVLNTEDLIIKQKGGVIKMHNKAASPENEKAGYKWQGRLQFYQGRDLMGHYCADRAENNTAKGMMYFHFNSARKEFVGRWVGCSYDGPLLCGFGVIAKDKARSLELLQELIKVHPDKVPIISYAMV
jgi:hypothetical protein